MRHCFLSGGLETYSIVGRRELSNAACFDVPAKGENAVTPRDSGEPLRVTPRSSQDEVYTDLPHKETPNGIFLTSPASKMQQIISAACAPAQLNDQKPLRSRILFPASGSFFSSQRFSGEPRFAVFDPRTPAARPFVTVRINTARKHRSQNPSFLMSATLQ